MDKLKLLSTLCLLVMLGGCADPEIKVVKESRFMQNMPTFGMILDDRADCGSIKWAAPTDDNGYKYVTATCALSRTMAREAKEQAISMADRNLSELVKTNKNYFERQLKRAEEDESFREQQVAAGGRPPTPGGATAKEYQEDTMRLSKRKQEAGAYLAEVDARKDRALLEFKALLDSGEPLAAEYYFQLRGQQAQLGAMRLIVGGKKHSVSDGSEMVSMVRLSNRELASERAWWAERLARLASQKSIEDCSYLQGCIN